MITGLLAMLTSLGQTSRAVAGSGSYIGVMMQEVDGDRAKELKLHEEAGVEITVVEKDGPADRGGLKVGDVVLRYNGQRVEGMEQLGRIVRETPPGRDVKIDISRGGVLQTIAVRVAQRKVQHWEMGDPGPMAMERLDIHIPDMPRTFTTLRSSMLGVEAESIDGQLAQYFGVKEGVLVRSVTKGSSAEKAGIRAGDVMLRIDDTRVANPVDISARLRTLGGKQASVVLMREHRELTVTVTISNDEPGGRIQITPFQVPNQF